METEKKDVFDEVLDDLKQSTEQTLEEVEEEKVVLKENKRKKQILFGNWTKDKEF